MADVGIHLYAMQNEPLRLTDYEPYDNKTKAVLSIGESLWMEFRDDDDGLVAIDQFAEKIKAAVSEALRQREAHKDMPRSHARWENVKAEREQGTILHEAEDPTRDETDEPF